MSAITDRWAFATPYLEMRYENQTLASGSSFFWKANDRTFLVSNWHNFSGRDPETGQPISKTGGLPNRLAFLGFSPVSEPDANGFRELTPCRVSIPLYKNEFAGSLWLEHPVFGRKVDVAAIDVSDVTKECLINFANELEADAVLTPYPSQDVFILGYPLGLLDGAPTAIWKRGTVATDPISTPTVCRKCTLILQHDQECQARW